MSPPGLILQTTTQYATTLLPRNRASDDVAGAYLRAKPFH